MPVACFMRRICVSLHFSFCRISSRLVPTCQSVPSSAPAEHFCAQTEHPPQRLSFTGGSAGSGASVSRLDRRTAPPYSFVTSRKFFPIHPSPARVATALCGRGVHQFSSFFTTFVVLAWAWNPFFTEIPPRTPRSRPTGRLACDKHQSMPASALSADP